MSGAVCSVCEETVRDPAALRIVLLMGALLLRCIRAVKASVVTGGRHGPRYLAL